MVVCPRCQHPSHGRSFCSRCGHLVPGSSPEPLPARVALPGGAALDCSAWHGEWPADCYRCLEAAAGGTTYRVYALNRGWWRDLRRDVERRASLTLAVLADLAVVPHDESAFVVARTLPGAARPLAGAPLDPHDDLARVEVTLEACELLGAALRPLHDAGLLWLNFDPAALEQAGEMVQLPGLDLQVFPIGSCPEILPVSAVYSPPEVCAFQTRRLLPATDVFHLGAYAYYRLAGLLPEGFGGAGLEAFGFDLPPLRVYRPGMPFGIPSVLSRATARDPADRFASVPEFLAAFRDAFSRASRRQQSACRVEIDFGCATATGCTHAAQGLPNQDRHTLLSLAPDAHLAVVADGVTHCLVGSGEAASEIAVDVLARVLPERLHQAETAGEVASSFRDAFLAAGGSILAAAQALCPDEELDPVSVMCSTALVAHVRENVLRLASVGDSRAYLVADGIAEQLTVDGDVRCTQLARGMPPEQVRELGPDGLSLYSCLGVGELAPGGRVRASVSRSAPQLGRWVLLPGDVVVLCSDGLVEEGQSLDPADLAVLAAAAPREGAAGLTALLVEAARAVQRPPSEGEPLGCGDDVTCVVLRVNAT